MGDGTYKTSIVKKTMIFLALRKTHGKTIGEAVRGVGKALKEAEQPLREEPARKSTTPINRQLHSATRLRAKAQCPLSKKDHT